MLCLQPAFCSLLITTSPPKGPASASNRVSWNGGLGAHEKRAWPGCPSLSSPPAPPRVVLTPAQLAAQASSLTLVCFSSLFYRKEALSRPPRVIYVRKMSISSSFFFPECLGPPRVPILYEAPLGSLRIGWERSVSPGQHLEPGWGLAPEGGAGSLPSQRGALGVLRAAWRGLCSRRGARPLPPQPELSC